MKKICIFVTFVFLLVFTACEQTTNIGNDDQVDINQIQVPEEFTYRTIQSVYVDLSVTDTSNEPVAGIIFNIYDNHPEDDGRFIAKGMTQSDGAFNTIVAVPCDCEQLTVVSPFGTQEVPIINGVLHHEYGDYTYLHPDSDDPCLRSGNSINNELSGNGNDNKTNLVTNGDFEINDFGSILHWSSPMPIPPDGRWYISQVEGSLEWYNDGGNHVIRSPQSYPSNDFLGGVCQLIEACEYEKFTISADIKYEGNNTEIYCCLGYRAMNSSGNLLDWWEGGIEFPSSSWTTITINTFECPWSTAVVNIYILVWDRNTDGSLLVDNVVVTKLGTDTDGDGVPDDEDDYPDDPDRAFNNYFPAENVYYTLAFEDKWPRKCDYDFNDIVLHWNFMQVTNASNELVDIHGSFKLEAIGAGYHDGFGVQFPFAITNFSDFDDHGDAHQYVDTGTNNAVVILFQDAFNLMQEAPGDPSTWINTVESEAYITPAEFEFTYTLGTPIATASLTRTPPYNPFIYVNNDRLLEIHLPDYEPTSKMAATPHWGTYDDDSNPGTDRYFKTSNNLPWVINVADEWEYPIEKSQITWAYLFFADWAESGGTLHTDWYDSSVPENIDANHIYSP